MRNSAAASRSDRVRIGPFRTALSSCAGSGNATPVLGSPSSFLRVATFQLSLVSSGECLSATEARQEGGPVAAFREQAKCLPWHCIDSLIRNSATKCRNLPGFWVVTSCLLLTNKFSSRPESHRAPRHLTDGKRDVAKRRGRCSAGGDCSRKAAAGRVPQAITKRGSGEFRRSSAETPSTAGRSARSVRSGPGTHSLRRHGAVHLQHAGRLTVRGRPPTLGPSLLIRRRYVAATAWGTFR